LEVSAAMRRLRDKPATLISQRLPFARLLDGLQLAGRPLPARVMMDFG
jgi:(R,R)-butanediol dehydrogenase / meso-butanediol dehydrogenase / diacetyl reductase